MDTPPPKGSIAHVFLLATEREGLLARVAEIDAELTMVEKAKVSRDELIPPRGRGRPKEWTDEMIKSVHDAVSAHQKQHGITRWWAAVYSWLIAGHPSTDPAQLQRFADDIAKNHVQKKPKPKNSKK